MFYKVLYKDPDGTLWSASKGFYHCYFEQFGRQYWINKEARMPKNKKLYGLLVFDTLYHATCFRDTMAPPNSLLIFSITIGSRIWKPGHTKWVYSVAAGRATSTNYGLWPDGTYMTNSLKLNTIVAN